MLAVCVVGALSTTGKAEEVNTRPNHASSIPGSCAAPLSTRKAKKPLPVKQTLFTQLQKEALFKRGARKRQTDCYISSESASEHFSSKTAFLIDLRDAQAFQAYRISGSLNIPAHTLKTKNFLKSRQLILVNEGYNDNRLEMLCLNLREAGFSKVSIMAGGLNQWQKHIAPLQGDLLAQRNLNQITPAQFFQVRDYEHWLVVNISPLDDKQRVSSDVLNLSISDKGPVFVNSLIAAVEERVSPYILIVSARGEDYLKVQARLDESDLKNPVFYLQGGRYAYQQFIEQQAVMFRY